MRRIRFGRIHNREDIVSREKEEEKEKQEEEEEEAAEEEEEEEEEASAGLTGRASGAVEPQAVEGLLLASRRPPA